MKNNKYLFLITLSYFALGLVNIHFALFGLVCMAIPLILLVKDKKKTWCQGYCPRACLYTTCGRAVKNSRKTPYFFSAGPMKWIMLAYFGISLFIIVMSTIAVAGGKPPLEQLRILWLIKIPSLPQLFDIVSPAWVLHLSYRFYSMMLTTTGIGLVLAFIYRPRTWCAICPISTVSGLYLRAIKRKTDKNQAAI